MLEGPRWEERLERVVCAALGSYDHGGAWNLWDARKKKVGRKTPLLGEVCCGQLQVGDSEKSGEGT